MLRKSMVVGLVVFATISLSRIILAADASPTGWVNSLKPKGQPGQELTLSSAGKTEYVILLAAEPTTQDTQAAAELSLHLKQITQATFPEVREGQEKLPAAAKVISIGQTELWKNTQLAEKAIDLGDEGYAISMKGDNLFLFGGKTRGPIFAVVALLEEDLGVRWYTFDWHNKGVTRIPQMVDLRFRPVPRTYVPQFELRQPYIHDANSGGHDDWALRNRVNAGYQFSKIRPEWGGGVPMAQEMFVHTFDYLVPRAKYFQDHPDYFSMRGGNRSSFQLCPSNPEVAKIITEDLLKRVKAGNEIFGVSPNDGGQYCECPQCKALNDTEASESAALLQLVNTVAAAVARTYPCVRISHLAYLGADTAPKSLKPHPNVIVFFCTDYDAWKWPFVPYSQTKVTKERLKGWADKGAYIYVWDYATNFSHFTLPFPNMQVVTENLRLLVDNKVKGVFLQGAYESLGSDRGVMRAWVWSKLFWNPSLNTEELVRDFTLGFYGPAAEPLQQYNELLDQIYVKSFPRFKAEYETGSEFLYNIRFDPDAVFLIRGPYLDEATKLFEKAEKLAADSGDIELQRRVKMAKVPLLYTKLCRGPGYFYIGSYSLYDQKGKYAEMTNEFEAIANDQHINVITETVRLDVVKKLAHWRKMLADAQ